MRGASPRFWIPILSASAILVMALSDLSREAPGALANVHEREEDLRGTSNCSSCHGGWFQNMDEACLKCHEDIKAQIVESDENFGLHSLIDEHKARLCALCHGEHHGEGFALVNANSFAAAGVPDFEEFDHGLIGFNMSGKHLEQDCSKCHVNSRLAILPVGGKRYLGLERNCVTCHEDNHKGRMKIACTSCHGQEDWSLLDADDHAERLPLVGGHAGLDCRECHAKDNAHSLEILGSARQLSPRDCKACHESPHDENFIQAFAQSTTMEEGKSCVLCHEAQHESFRDEKLELTPEQHALSGFPLIKPHDKAKCDDCHDKADEEFVLRYPGRKRDQCHSCHDDPHAAQFDASPLAKNGCIDCHEREEWKPHAFNIEKHALTPFPLDGKHEQAECDTCHKSPGKDSSGKDIPRVFHGTNKLCQQCHDDAHDDHFAAFAKKLAKEKRGTCAACHMTDSFSTLPNDRFDHGYWTGFPLTGAHAQTDCESCHERSTEPDKLGRTFGRVATTFGTWKKGGLGCITCHKDPHDGEFDKARLPPTFQRKKGCLRCHVQSSFRSFPKGFEHGRWTGFSLLDEHRKIDCSACHEQLAQRDADGRTWGRAKGRHCNDCHEDPHAGQFLQVKPGSKNQVPSTDCRKCHRSSASFKTLSFDHDMHSRFPLGKAHEPLACSACHKKERIDKTLIVRYRPLGRNCTDCHESQVDPLRKRRGGKR